MVLPSVGRFLHSSPKGLPLQKRPIAFERGPSVSQKLSIERIGPVAVVRLTNPPRNFLGPILRAELSTALAALMADAEVAGVVLTGSDGLFSTGYNAAVPDTRAGDPSLRALCRQIEDSPKPVVAALFGAATGAGLELALAAHARVALRSTQVAMPDVMLGLPPAAGGTQRLPRILGADRALALMLSGQAVPVTHPRVTGLIDELVPDGVEKAAFAYLTRLAAKELPVRRSRVHAEGLSDPVAFQTAVAECRTALGEGATITETALVDCVERALLLPYDMGEEFEAMAYAECAASDYAQGLLHVQLAQRRAPNMPEGVSAKPQPIERIGLVGGGAVAAGLARAALLAGKTVIWFERNEQAAATARKRLETGMDALHVEPETRRACLVQLTQTTNLRDLAAADLVIEAVADVADTKAQVFTALDKVMPAATWLMSHTGTLPIQPIGQVAGRTGQLVGFYMMPNSPLAEVIPGPDSSATAVVSCAGLLQQIGVLPVRAGTAGGTIGARMTAALRDCADYLLGLGISAAQVDAALVAFGLRGGVFAAMDALGLDVVLRRARQLHRPESYALTHLARLTDLVRQGHTGRSAGQGFFKWEGDRPIVPDEPDTGPIEATQIQHLCLGALLNEGARLLREGAALRPSDIDLVMIRHHGFPAGRGGPMQAADRAGLFTLVRAMKSHEDTAPHLFAPDLGIAKLIRNGETLDVLNTVGRGRRRIGD